MTARLLVALLGCITFSTTALVLNENRSIVERIAAGMAGEQWYRIQLNQDHVGYMYNHAYRDEMGRWHFQTTTHFRLQDNAPNTISKHLTFAARPPYSLTTASYQNRRGPQQLETTAISRSKSGYKAAFNGNRETQLAMDWHYDLAAFVGFEQWLATQRPSAGAVQSAESIDFERLSVTRRSYRVVERNAEGVLVETNAPQQATQTQLDHQFRPLRLNMAGIFDVVATDEADAIALTKMRRKTNYLFSLNERLMDHTQLQSLELKVHSDPSLTLPATLKLTANPVTSQGDGSGYLGEALRYPVTDPRIQALVQQSLRGARGPEDQLAQLVYTAHKQIQYVEDEPAGSVANVLATGQGECTDFADLFNTMARAAGYPARNVYGLAYKDGSNPAFMFHAWNEIYIDGQWRAVDPTWNQVRVDATHIPLSNTQAALMMLANNTGQISFEVTAKSYFTST